MYRQLIFDFYTAYLFNLHNEKKSDNNKPNLITNAMETQKQKKQSGQLEILEQLRGQLSYKGFSTVFCKTRKEAQRYVEENIPNGSSVRITGLDTLEDLGINTVLVDKDMKIMYHKPGSSSFNGDDDDVAEKPVTDFHIAGANAVTEDGQIVSIDDNRLQSTMMLTKSKQVYLFAGINKITADINDAIWRIKNIIMPLKSRKEKLGAPCEIPGYCVECKTRASLCKVTNILEFCPPSVKITIILLPQSLGY